MTTSASRYQVQFVLYLSYFGFGTKLSYGKGAPWGHYLRTRYFRIGRMQMCPFSCPDTGRRAQALLCQFPSLLSSERRLGASIPRTTHSR